MEHTRIPVNEVKKILGLSDRQMSYILNKFRKFHREDRWIRRCKNAQGTKELWIYLEGIEWIETVFLRQNKSYEEAELDFLLNRIDVLLKKLHISHDFLEPIDEEQTIHELSIYFGKKENTIYKEIKKHIEIEPFIIERNPLKLSKDGVKWLLINVYRKPSIEKLYFFKRALQEIIRDRNKKNKS